MKKIYLLTLLTATILSCSNTKSDNENSSSAIAEEVTETAMQQEDVELDSGQQALIYQLQGSYYMLSTEEDNVFFEEPCGLSKDHDVEIYKKLDDVNFWEVTWYDEIFPVHSVLKENEEIIIESGEERLYFKQTKRNKLWNFNVLGYRDTFPIVRSEDIEAFDTTPCTDMEEILSNLSSAYYQLSSFDGDDVIIMPCQSAPGGFVLGDNTLDFGSGSDPYPIESVSKASNVITIYYEGGVESIDTTYSLQIKILSRNLVEGTDGTKYVSEEGRQQYDEIEEEC